MINAQSATSDEAGLLLRALQQAKQPLPVTKLRSALPNALRPSKGRLKQLLDELISLGQVRSSSRGKSVYYWPPELEEEARARILEAIGNQPLTQRQLKGKFRSLLVGWPGNVLQQMLEQLIEERRVYKLPAPAGKGFLLSAHPPDPRQYLQEPVRKLIDKLYKELAKELDKLAKKLEITTAALSVVARELLQQALTTEVSKGAGGPVVDISEASQLILAAMVKIEPAAANGALVPLRDLRQALKTQIPDKVTFDRGALQLFAQGQVDLTRHHHPSILSEAEREELVSDSQGNYYNGIVLRRGR
jgi:hypothetical protein